MLKNGNSGKSVFRVWQRWFAPLRQSNEIFDERALEDALNSLDLALIYFDMDGNLKTANCRACRLIPELGSIEDMDETCRSCKLSKGCSRATRPITNLPQFISFIFDKSVDAHNQADLFLEDDQRDSNSFREIIELKGGRYFLVRAVPQKSQGTIVELTDISMVKTRNDHLSRLGKQNHILMEAIQTSRMGVFVAENKSEERKVLFVNQALSNLLGHDCNDYMDKSLFSFCKSEFKDSCEQLSEIIDKNEKAHVWKDKTLPNGERIWLEIDLSPAGKDNDLLIGVFADQTQVKMQESRLQQTQKLEAIGQLAGGVAHDFNNILAIMEGYARMTESAWRRGEDISTNLKKIYQAIQRGSGLTRQLLTFGKHRIAEDKAVDLCAQIEEVKTFLLPLMGVNVELDVKIEDMPLYIKGTPDLISQIIMNLSINARDAMPRGGTITITVRKDKREDKGGGARLTVSDTGTGMTRGVMEKMFDPFFTTKEQGKGTGLGLSMVYGLVQQMKGEMNVDSEFGIGTTFTIWFPEAAAPQNVETEEKKDVTGTMLEGKTVVLAEDEPDLLEIMKVTLEGFGMKVLKAVNGNEALEVQDEYDGNIDFLLTDMVMPQLGGLQLAELFHEVRPETRIVFMSGYPVRGEISEIELPDDAIFMAKPIMQENLKRVMEQVSQGQSVQASAGVVWE